MTNQEKLEALAERALRNGHTGKLPVIFDKDGKQFINTKDLLFNHDFARALFEDQEEEPTGLFEYNDLKQTYEEIFVKDWQYHLQQAVISDDPIGYYYKAVFGDK